MRKALKIVVWVLLLIVVSFVLLLRFGTELFDPSPSEKEIATMFSGTDTLAHIYDTVDGEHIHYVQVGSNCTASIVFVHGSPGDWRGWAGFLADSTLQKLGCLVAVDRLGYGQSQPGVAHTSLQEQAAVFGPLLQQLHQQGPVILVGHSYGGPVVARMAMELGEWADGLVIVAGSISPEDETPQWYNNLASAKALQWVLPEDMRVSNLEIMPLKKELQDMLPLWESITQPVVIIHGTTDQLVPVANADFAAQVLTHADTLIINKVPKTGHLIPWKKPELIDTAILPLLHHLH